MTVSSCQTNASHLAGMQQYRNVIVSVLRDALESWYHMCVKPCVNWRVFVSLRVFLLLLSSGYIGLRIVALEEQLTSLGALPEFTLQSGWVVILHNWGILICVSTWDPTFIFILSGTKKRKRSQPSELQKEPPKNVFEDPLAAAGNAGKDLYFAHAPATELCASLPRTPPKGVRLRDAGVDKTRACLRSQPSGLC